MTCPYHDDRDDDAADGDESGLDRGQFMKAALAIGGANALATASNLYDVPGTVAAGPGGSVSIGERQNRQHAWDAFELYDEDKETSLPPEAQLLLNVEYVGTGVPSATERQTVEDALFKLEDAFGWGHDGLLFTIGYSPAYFARFGGADAYPLPRGLDPANPAGKPGLLTPEALIDTPGVTLERERQQDSPEPDGTTGVVADDYDAVIHLASDDPAHLLAAERALWEETTVNGVEFDAPFDGILSKPEEPPDRRVGFVGHDIMSENLEKRTDFEETKIPEDAVLSMGFNDLFRNSIPRETNATILEDQRLVQPKPPGMFAQGAIQHLSKLDINLGSNVGGENDGWYDDHDIDGRRERMFSPEHTEANTGTVGEALGNSNAPGETPMRDISADTDVAEGAQQDATDRGVVGHAQKVARARFDLNTRLVDESNGGLPSDHPARLEVTRNERGEAYGDDLPGHDGPQEAEQVMLRRDFAGISNENPGNHFNALMRFNPYMGYMRQAMNGVAFDSKAFGLTGDARINHDELNVTEENNGILGYLTTRRRANYLVPPITLRALPPAHAARPPAKVVGDPVDDDSVDVVVGTGTDDYGDLYDAPGDAPGGEEWVEYSDPADIDPATVRFGDHWVVNRGGGASPTASEYDAENATLTLSFDDLSEAGFTDRSVRARLFAKTDDRFPVFATVALEGT